MNPFDRNQNLTASERIQRIGELLAIAVMRYRRLHPEEFPDRPRFGCSGRPETAASFDRGYFVSDESEKRILNYLSRIGAAAPRDFQVALGISRISVIRKLARLRAANLVTVSGKTRAIRYELPSPDVLRRILPGQSGNPARN